MHQAIRLDCGPPVAPSFLPPNPATGFHATQFPLRGDFFLGSPAARVDRQIHLNLALSANHFGRHDGCFTTCRSPPMKLPIPEVPAVAAALSRNGLTDWIGEGTGKWSLPVMFLPDDGGWVELMRLKPGVRIDLHRHSGEVHGLNLQGTRRLNDGRVIGPGDYVFEPPGNVDWWEATGDEDLIVHVVVRGAVEYLGPHHTVKQRIATRDRIADYARACAAIGITPRALA
jgi:2,4'-dihydroxyacetophenone dioxygenase